MASIISAGTTSGTSLNLSGDTSGVLQLASNGSTTAVTIDTSQNVGIGTSSPTGKLEVTGGQLRVTASSASSMFLVNPSTTYADGVDIQATYNGAGSFGPLKFTTSGTERMRIDSAGAVLIGTSSRLGGGLAGLDINSGGASGVTFGWGGTNEAYIYLASASIHRWETETGTTVQVISGSAGVSLANGGTSWGSLSDERKKDIIEPITNATAKIATLRTVIGKYKTDEEDRRRAFLIAQDVEKI
jgi:hypothetical protein